jgi:hypothetical protein
LKISHFKKPPIGEISRGGCQPAASNAGAWQFESTAVPRMKTFSYLVMINLWIFRFLGYTEFFDYQHMTFVGFEGSVKVLQDDFWEETVTGCTITRRFEANEARM